MANPNVQVRDGASPGLAGPSDLFIPLVSEVWTNGDTVYSYNEKDGIGTWDGTSFASIYAPESGQWIPMKDGTWVVEVDAGDHIRQWIGINPLDDIYSVSPGKVLGGKKIGTSKGPFSMALWITRKGQSKAEAVNPAQTLVFFKAHFVDIQERKAQAQAAKSQAAGKPQQTSTALATTNTPSSSPPALASSAPQDFFAAKKERTFSAGQVAAIAGLSLLGGGLVIWLAKSR